MKYYEVPRVATYILGIFIFI